MYVPIGGIEQWIQIGGQAPSHPVLLYLHGGPGGTSVPAAAAWQPWEAHFTVVHWDQRGAGRTYRRNGAAGCGRLTLERMVQDGIEVAEFLIAHTGQPKIFLVGHSWGSALGIHLLKRRPELFSAYVGTGQLVRVPARTSSFYFKGKQATLADIGKALNVSHVLEGSVQKSDRQVRITTELVNVADDSRVWPESYDRKLDDIFKVQDNIATSVV